MKEGAFALIDCLGFKGIWEKYDAQVVINKLLNIDETIKRELSSSTTSVFEIIKSGYVIPKVKLLSDTVAISLKYESKFESVIGLSSAQLVGALCLIIPVIIDYFIETEPHLLVRGCITFGEHIMQENFIIGRAVDEAAEGEKIAQGAFIWLTPKASEQYKQFTKNILGTLNNTDENLAKLEIEDELKYLIYKIGSPALNKIGFPPIILENYDMPIKNGEVLECSVINPLAKKVMAESRKKVAEIYHNEMCSENPDVIIKRENTMKFLQEAEKQSEQYQQSIKTFLSQNHHLAQSIHDFNKHRE